MRRALLQLTRTFQPYQTGAVSCCCSSSVCLDATSFLSTSLVRAASTSAATADSSGTASGSSSSSSPAKAARSATRSGKQPQASDTAPASAGNGLDVLLQLQRDYQRSRMQQFYKDHLSRELMLKLNVDSVHELPRVRKVDIAIQARFINNSSYVNKWELLLPALGLEFISSRAATMVGAKQKYYAERGAVTGVRLSLRGSEAHDFLEKLVYLVLPSQNAFEGLLMRSLDRLGHLHFRVQNMINFPDYEEAFETFENLGSMQVSVVLDNVQKHPERSRVLLTGLQVPLFVRRKRVGDSEDAAEGSGADVPATAGTTDV